MNWDPSMATKGCDVCGKSVEAWIDTCDDCIEKADNMLHEIDKLELELSALIENTKELKRKFDNFLPDEKAITDRMEVYFTRRLESFRDEREAFAFYQIREPLEEIIGKDEE